MAGLGPKRDQVDVESVTTAIQSRVEVIIWGLPRPWGWPDVCALRAP